MLISFVQNWHMVPFAFSPALFNRSLQFHWFQRITWIRTWSEYIYFTPLRWNLWRLRSSCVCAQVTTSGLQQAPPHSGGKQKLNLTTHSPCYKRHRSLWIRVFSTAHLWRVEWSVRLKPALLSLLRLYAKQCFIIPRRKRTNWHTNTKRNMYLRKRRCRGNEGYVTIYEDRRAELEC